MKMARSHTRKKFAKNPRTSVPKEITNVAADYIKQWTSRELGRIQGNEPQPVCVQIKNGYLVGLYRLIVNPNKTCDLFDINRELVHRFESKISAILYAIYTTKRQYAKGDEIISVDRVINKCYTDMLYLRNIIEKAKKQQDYVIVDTRLPRLEIAETSLNLARDRMTKIHNLAKYYKVWE
jgi:hypothetical protein